MRVHHIAAAALLLGTAACGRNDDAQAPLNNDEGLAGPQGSAPAAVTNTPAPAATNAPKRQLPTTSLAEPKGPIDPKSVEAAGQVVQLYAAYLESGQLAKAAAQWSDAGAARQFAEALKRPVHVEIGDLGPAEGAAGSIYTTMPVTFTEGQSRRRADVILRRVNDVPGSTEAQRRWHIERIEWKDAA